MTKSPYRIAALLFLACGAIYLPTVGFNSIEVDDPKHIFENPMMLAQSWTSLFQFWRSAYFGLYIPVTYTVWFLLSRLGLNPQEFHALNFALHFVNGYLVYQLIKQLCKNEICGFIGALLFLCHPIQVEAVAWISGTKDLLSALFALLYLSRATSTERHLHWWVTSLLYTLALLAKPGIAAVPLFVVVYLKYMTARPWKEIGKLTLLPMAFSLGLLVLTKTLQPDSAVQHMSQPNHRLMIALDALIFYGRTIIAPFQLALDYGHSPNGIHLTSLWVSIITVLGGILIYLMKRQFPLFFLGCLLFLLSVLPVLGFIPFQYQFFSTVADRFAYFGMVGISLAFAELLSRLSRFPRFQMALTTLLLTLLIPLSFRQVSYWKSNDSLFAHSIEMNPNSLLAHNNWAYSLFHQGKYAEAASHFARVVELNPQEAGLHRNYGASLIKMGKISEGERELRLAGN